MTSPRQFARIFLQDLDLPIDPYLEIIANSIEQQIDDAHIADIQIGPSPGGPWAEALPGPAAVAATAAAAAVAQTSLSVASNGPSANGASAAAGSSANVAGLEAGAGDKDARQWDWGVRENFHAAALRGPPRKRQRIAEMDSGDGLAAAATADEEPEFEIVNAGGDVEDDLRVVIDVSAGLLFNVR